MILRPISRHISTRTLAALAIAFLGTLPAFCSVTTSKTSKAKTPVKTTARKRVVGKRTVAARSTVVHTRRVATTTANETRAAVIHTTKRATLRAATARRRVRGRSRVFFNPWTEPTYADSTVGDNVDGEDLVVRRAAVDALGPFNGSVVVADPKTGRILSMVNQKLAMTGAYQPCSTVKVMVSLASLKEQVIDPTTEVKISRRSSMDMTRALAMSNNLYFAKLGQELGFDRVRKYGEMFGLGEKAGLNIAGEEPGYLASETPTSGIGMMTSFGDGIRLTPLELTSMISSVANGGTLYYLQYPKSQDEVKNFTPQVKRNLEISDLIPEVKAGMMGAVEYGTARRISYSNTDTSSSILGKTGTCTDTARPGVHLGWFGSFNEVGDRKLVVVVLLTGGRGVSGPIASGVAGNLYHNLATQNYFGAGQQPELPTSLVSLKNSYEQ
jgi:penicillin-binding protein 2